MAAVIVGAIIQMIVNQIHVILGIEMTNMIDKAMIVTVIMIDTDTDRR